jgi:hypothetical protein
MLRNLFDAEESSLMDFDTDEATFFITSIKNKCTIRI